MRHWAAMTSTRLADWALAESGLSAQTPHDRRTLLVAARAAKEALTEATQRTDAVRSQPAAT
jgi:hypothetical protein